MPREYEFNDRLVMSDGVAAGADVCTVLIENIPSVVAAHKAHEANDRNGTDWWAETGVGKLLSVDCKVRSADWAARGQDDLALESWSVVEKSVVGWTRDRKKQTDYVLWLWTDTGRWCLVPFPFLCRVYEQNWQIWRQRYKTRKQFTPNHGGYHSECTFVPRRVVWAEIYKTFSGCPESA